MVKIKLTTKYFTLSRLISLKRNHFPTKTITGLPNLSTPLWYKQPIPETSDKSSVLALRNNLSYLNKRKAKFNQVIGKTITLKI